MIYLYLFGTCFHFIYVFMIIGNSLKFIQHQHCTIISFSKPNNEYLIREIIRYIGNANTHNEIKLDNEILNFSIDEKSIS